MHKMIFVETKINFINSVPISLKKYLKHSKSGRVSPEYSKDYVI